MTAFYNEIDPYAAQWLRNLIAAGHIAPGVVDERSIEDIAPEELFGFTQCHFFAGIGVWSLALRRAGWPDDRPVWTGSCPCQPFSAAGAGAGFSDERHLWPSFAWIISQCSPPIIFGEQVASKPVEPWVDLVHADLEAMGYAFGCVPFPSAGVGAPHIRDRAYWVADSNDPGLEGRWELSSQRTAERPTGASGVVGGLADMPGGGRGEERQDAGGQPVGDRSQGWPAGSEHGSSDMPAGPVNGFWRNADWLGCRDDKWRPVEPGTFPLVNGVASRMVCVCPDCKTETMIYENMHSLRSLPIGNQGRGQEEVLRQGMLQAASFVAAAHKQKYGTLPGQGCGEKHAVQSLLGHFKPGSSSPRQECSERQPEQLGEDLLSLSRLGTSSDKTSINMRSVWGALHRSLASEPQQDLFCPLCQRVGPQECFEEVGGARTGRIRAYGNAINAEAATQFILAYLDTEQSKVIYLTPYDTTTLACTGASTDSGFTTLDEVRQMMGEPDMAHPRMLTYGESCFTDFPLSLTPTATPCNTAPNSAQSSN